MAALRRPVPQLCGHSTARQSESGQLHQPGAPAPVPVLDMHLLCDSSSAREAPRRVWQPTTPAIIPQLEILNRRAQAPQGTPCL
ncbi:hypothetical protein NDU88_005773 [Pleurodeles waltl]|uniref:Uncharacterized protein n=1 Tax=Pleurodeles waltl TaxID=8319 RepID=A0AAV7NXI7_PLEWA|nr:hypothetical protein NDU88_005773 [Pleurodeles waltl]